MKKLIILLILLVTVLFTTGCTENPDNSTSIQEKSVVVEITDLAQINTSVQEGPVFLKIGAEWCGPCQQLKPVLSDLAAKYGGKVTIMSADIDQSPQLAAYFGIGYIPDSFMVVGIEDGEYVYMQEDGNITKDRFQARVLGVRESQVYEELMNRAILYDENIDAE